MLGHKWRTTLIRGGILLYQILSDKFVPFNMSAAPLVTNKSPGETSIPGRLTTTELRLLSCSLRGEETAQHLHMVFPF